MNKKQALRKRKFIQWVIEMIVIAAISFTIIRGCGYIHPTPIKPALICEFEKPCRPPYIWEW